MKKPTLVDAAIVVVVGVIVAFLLFEVRAEYRRFFQTAEAWCHARNGTLVEHLAGGGNGGLHCKLPNGTSVDMSAVLSD